MEVTLTVEAYDARWLVTVLRRLAHEFWMAQAGASAHPEGLVSLASGIEAQLDAQTRPQDTQTPPDEDEKAHHTIDERLDALDEAVDIIAKRPDANERLDKLREALCGISHNSSAGGLIIAMLQALESPPVPCYLPATTARDEMYRFGYRKRQVAQNVPSESLPPEQRDAEATGDPFGDPGTDADLQRQWTELRAALRAQADAERVA